MRFISFSLIAISALFITQLTTAAPPTAPDNASDRVISQEEVQDHIQAYLNQQQQLKNKGAGTRSQPATGKQQVQESNTKKTSSHYDGYVEQVNRQQATPYRKEDYRQDYGSNGQIRYEESSRYDYSGRYDSPSVPYDDRPSRYYEPSRHDGSNRYNEHGRYNEHSRYNEHNHYNEHSRYDDDSYDYRRPSHSSSQQPKKNRKQDAPSTLNDLDDEHDSFGGLSGGDLFRREVANDREDGDPEEDNVEHLEDDKEGEHHSRNEA